MSFPRSRTINGLQVILEPTSRNTYSLWLPGQQPQRETFYSLWHIGRHWLVTRYQANPVGIAFDGTRVGDTATKAEAITLAVTDYQYPPCSSHIDSADMCPSAHVCICGKPLNEHRTTSAQCPTGGNFYPNPATLARFPQQYQKDGAA